MKVYVGFDDTDTHDSPFGTGKLVRWFQRAIPRGCGCLGVVRQQLLVCDDIAYTSHNSAACLIVDIPHVGLLDDLIARAAAHLNRHAVEGSDPGLCVAAEVDRNLGRLVDFGKCCVGEVLTQKKALRAAKYVHLSGHGGSNDGIIGAAAAVGLTLFGWAGRYIEFGNLRSYPEQVSVAALNAAGIEVVSAERDAKAPAADDTVRTNGWLRPKALGHQPVLLVAPLSQGRWQNIYFKRNNGGPP